MIARIIEASVRNRFIVLLVTVAVALWGVWAIFRTPVDAIPDLSENQTIVWADWPGRSPKEIEEQITYPLSVNLQGLAGVKAIRATSEFGFSMINIIFEEKIEFYFARQRVLERLSIASSFLPAGVVPYLAPDATALGQIFWYTVEGEGKRLDELRAIQDWTVRYQLNSVPGVTQVASVGGFVREYQVDIAPEKLRAYDISLGQVFRAVMASNSSVGGKVIQKGGSEYLVRGYGWIQGIEDLRDVVVAERKGVPITVDRLGTVQLGPAFRRGVLEKNGREAVGGVVMMRWGENPLEVTQRVKAKIKALESALPPGVRIVPFYERTGLIGAAIDTLKRTLIEEIAIASVVVFLVLWHLRSAIAICITLPLAVLVSFIFMYYLGVPSNIMSLSGIAISIGVLVDAGIVMTENAYHRLHDHFQDGRVTGDTRELVIAACQVVGGPIFFSILIMLLSFAPIFVLGGIEGKMFNPLAYTKGFALLGVAVMAITLVPAILPTLIRGRLRSQDDVWLVRSFVNIYRPMLAFFLRFPDVLVVITSLFLLAAIPLFPRQTAWVPKMPWLMFVIAVPFIVTATTLILARQKLACLALLLVVALAGWRQIKPLGEEFMPPLDELSIMDMPVTTPNVNITQAADDIKARDGVLRGFPEVHQVVGKLGRAETPTDPAPVDMVETVVSLRPKEWWPRRKIRHEELVAEAREVARALERAGVLAAIPAGELKDFANTAAMTGSSRFDRTMRELAARRLREYVPEQGRELARLLRGELVAFLAAKDALKKDLPEGAWAAADEELAGRYGTRWMEWVLVPDVTRATREIVAFLESRGAVESRTDLLVEPPSLLSAILDPLRSVVGREKPTLHDRLRERLEARQDELVRARVRAISWEIEDRAPESAVWHLIEGAVETAREQGRLARKGEPDRAALLAVRAERAKAFGRGLLLWRKDKADLVKEMDSELQMPGWGNIWTQPIINRVDMLATGVRTMIGVKVFGPDLDGIQKVSGEIAAVLKGVRGAVDVFPDQLVGENYLEIKIDRKKAARYGVSVEDIQSVIEVALGGREITLTVEGAARFPVRVRYPRDWREDEERVNRVLVPARGAAMEGGAGMGEPPPAPAPRGEGMNGMPTSDAGSSLPGTQPAVRLRQVPLGLLAEVKIVSGPSMIKSENGALRAYVQLNVRDRDIVGFVEEAQRAVEAQVKLPPGYHLEWSGQFEHQVRAQRTLMVVLPMVVLIIFLILYLTYRDFPDTLMMFLAVPGAVAGGAIFQSLFGYNFSVAVWVGYIACFGLATETGIVMLVYLREAIERRGGIEAIQSEQEIHDAVMEGAVNRLRPKLLTEGTTILALIPMLWSTGVGAEFMSPMAAPILGGILVADEVIDILIPVLFHWDRCRRLRKRLAAESGA